MTSAGSKQSGPLTVESVAPRPEQLGALRIALLGNPNTGKTTLFNQITGLRHKTSNFAGTTVEARVGLFRTGPQPQAAPGAAGLPEVGELIDMPGIYSLELDQIEAEICRQVLAGRAAPKGDELIEPDGVCVVVDATNLARNLVLAGEALRRRLPTVVAVNMIDLAAKQGLSINPEAMAERLGCPVVLVNARSGQGVQGLQHSLLATIARGDVPTRTPPGDEAALRRWADDVFAVCASSQADPVADTLTDRLDRTFTHPVLGTIAFVVVMAGLFYTLFSLARFPMEWIDHVFSVLGGLVSAALPPGLVHDLLRDGVVSGVGATLIFLPQICLLFFLISLLEDTGYLARAAFVMDRVLRPFGLPGHSFVPLLSSHACALPGIMSARCIPDPRQRLATILVAPFMSCSARLPVYVLLTGLLFPTRPLLAALAFVGCYAAGIGAGVFSALIARRTVLRGKSRPMALELPSYKMPSLRTALITTADRGLMFLRKAGTNILAITVLLWWLGAFPHVSPPAEAVRLREQAAVAPAADPQLREQLTEQADRLEKSHAKAHSFIGMIGRTAEPVFAPLGYDWRLAIGVMASFAAREVFVSTMSVVVAGRDDVKDQEPRAIREQLATATRDDGRTLVFKPSASWSLLVFYVLAMQCLPTLIVTAREAGGARWAVLQLVWMSGLAYAAAFGTYRICLALGLS